MQAMRNVFKTQARTYVLTFYDMQSQFQNKVVLPKKAREVHFITSLNIMSRVSVTKTRVSIDESVYSIFISLHGFIAREL
jgi:hypothetical protein